MKKGIKLYTLIGVLAISAVSLSCNKQKTPSPKDTSEFCTYVAEEDYANAGGIINQYLKGQKESLSDEEKIDQLKDWLMDRNCVSDVTIYCIGCIQTLPEQTELRITFNISGRSIEKTLDVYMDHPLRIRVFHD